MKHLIILISMLTAPLIIQAQEYSAEYKVVCRRVVGCPIEINGTCPTCLVQRMGQVEEQFDYEAWGEELRESLRYMWDPNYFKNDEVKREPSWGWDGPTWKGLRVPYN